MFGREEHGRAIVRAEEAYAFFGDLGELEQRHHLEAAVGVSYGACIYEERGITHPPLSATVSTLFEETIHLLWISVWASTCENIVRP